MQDYYSDTSMLVYAVWVVQHRANNNNHLHYMQSERHKWAIHLNSFIR